MHRRSVDLDTLILEIHSVSLRPEAWAAVLEHLRKLMCADSALLHATAPRTADEYWYVGAQIDPEMAPQYADHWVDEDLWALGARRSGRTGTGVVSTDEDLVDRRGFARSAFFNDFLRPFDFDRTINVVLSQPNASFSMSHVLMAFFRNLGREPFSALDKQAFQRLAPHLTLATRNFWLARGLTARGAALESALDALTVSVVGVDRAAHVVFMNSTAERMLKSACWLRVRQGSLTLVRSVTEGKVFVEAIRSLQRGLGTSILLTDRTSGRTAVMTTMPITSDSVDSLPRNGATGLVWLVATQPDISSVAQLARCFELTDRKSVV